MWLKSAIEKEYGLHRERREYKKDKTVDELLNRIILSDCAEWYMRQYGNPYTHIHHGSTASLDIDFDLQRVNVKIMMKYYQHKSSNIHKLYEYLLKEKVYHCRLNDMIYDVTTELEDVSEISITFYYDMNNVLNQ